MKVQTDEKILFSWSGGKESALALHELIKENRYYISALLTVLIEDDQRICMHRIRSKLLEDQASALGLQLEKIFIPANVSNEEYESRVSKVLSFYSLKGVSRVVFGDVFLEDVRKYRENNLKRIYMKGFFPVWKRNTTELARQFIDYGFKAIVTCVDSQMLDKNFAGRIFDDQFLDDLPSGVDPCGENGEFHTFVYDGPIFREKVLFRRGEVFLKDDRFNFCDLIGL